MRLTVNQEFVGSIPTLGAILKGKHHEYISVNDNAMKINLTRQLIRECTNPVKLRQLKSDLTCYKAIKVLLDKKE
jgi:predicted transcriptional regulator